MAFMEATIQVEQLYDVALERRIKWKLDLTILPFLVSIHFLSQLVNSDLGNAKLAGMEEELDISPKSYSLIASMTLIGTVIFQLPGTVLIRRIGPSYQFAGALFFLGLFTTCITAAKTSTSLMALRLLVGVADAFAHGTLLYLTFWYKYDELAIRGALFSGTASLAGAFNGVIASTVSRNMQNHYGWKPWRWIFFIDGIIPVGWGFLVAMLLPSTPETIRWLFTPGERDLVISRSRATHNTGASNIQPRAILQVLGDPIFWMLTLVNCGIHFTETSLPNFVPAIIDGIGWSGEQAQLKSSIVYVCAFASTMFWATISSKFTLRGVLIIINCGVSLLGLILLRLLTQPTARLVALCLLVAGIYPCVLLVYVWLAVTISGYTHRASASAIINMVALLFGILGNQVYVDPPLYHQGIAVSSAFIATAAIVTLGLLCHLRRLNKRKETARYTARARELRESSIDTVGNLHPDFMYGY